MKWSLRLFESISRKPKPEVVTIGFLLITTLGAIDYVTGPDLSFLVFYLIPVLLVAWFAGATAGTVLSVISAVFLFADDVIGRKPYLHPVVPYWNVAVKFLVFVILTNLISVLKNALEREKLTEQEHLRREIEIAREVQERLFPQVLPRMESLEYTGICKPVYGVGGDYYDFIQISADRLGIAIGDVAGKGISSALLMASLQATLRSQAFQRQNQLEVLITEVNRFLCAHTTDNKFITLFYSLYDQSIHTLTYVNAGHNPPLIRRADGKWISLEACGIVLGLVKNAAYRHETVRLNAGDLLVLYTDGITEAMNEADEQYGEERLVALLTANSDLPVSELRDLIFQDVMNFVGDSLPQDDMTLVILRVHPTVT